MTDRRMLARMAGVVTLFVVASAAALAITACGDTGERPPEPKAAAPSPAPPPPGPRLYVSDETDGNVLVIDPEGGRLLEKIPVGKRPRGLHLSKDGTMLYVALSGSPDRPTRRR